MPVTPTYPGVYIEEVQSSVHTIVGVPTSVAAFVGYAARGLVDTPVQVNSWADYQRAFGGLDPSSPMSYAAFLFFMNGGNSAQIVRASATDKSGAPAKIAIPPAAATAAGTVPAPLILVATSPGTWGNQLTVTVDTDKLVTPGLFNLTITDGGSGAVESYTGLSVSASAAGTPGTGIATALASSALMNVDPTSAATQAPEAGTYNWAGPVPAAETAPAGTTTAGTTTAGATTAGATTAATPPAGSGKGADINADSLAVPGDQAAKTGIYALLQADIFNILCLPTNPSLPAHPAQQPYPAATLSLAAQFCAQQRAMLLVDPPTTWSQGTLTFETVTGTGPDGLKTLAISGSNTANAAIYYPNLRFADPVTNTTVPLGPCGAVAGVWASTDDARGVWKAPAGTAAALTGISDLSVPINDSESGVLNPIAVNCLRTLPLIGPVSWGARTAAGADELASQWKYIPVRRTALFIEESIRRGTQWAVFEPNDEPLWSSVRLNIGAFMNSLFKQGAFQGSTPAEAYLVQCDADNNPQSSINLGILNILVGFQPLVPAEFVIIQIEQLAGQLQG